ncbi:anti-sigma factor [Gordonia sp. CPCC 205515]|uniref:anti-sigma factor n=1 Tax=Gordonia sp. CPCC 205515 TaxID=3140791 RepID=UPI003AF346F9
MPEDDELLDLAPAVGLDAVHGTELDSVTRAVDAAPDEVRARFEQQVQATREAMAQVSGVTATAPPATLRERVLAAAQAESTTETTASPPADTAEINTTDTDTTATVTPLHRGRRRLAYLAAAAVAAIAIGAVGWAIGASSDSNTPQQATAEQVFAANDVRSASADVATGHATVTYSPSEDAGVLVMNDVPPPKPGTVYQMWLSGPEGMTSAGTMTDKDVAPSTTAVIDGLHGANALAFTVEPPGGSTQPTGPVVAEVPLS